MKDEEMVYRHLTKEEPAARRYLGDGVYAEIERGMAKLTTRTGSSETADVTNTIYLEVPVMIALIKWWTDLHMPEGLEDPEIIGIEYQREEPG